jgi:hypothetical protein
VISNIYVSLYILVYHSYHLGNTPVPLVRSRGVTVGTLKNPPPPAPPHFPSLLSRHCHRTQVVKARPLPPSAASHLIPTLEGLGTGQRLCLGCGVFASRLPWLPRQ